MPITIRCPNPDCGRPYQVREESLGSRATCKKCGTTFTIEMQAEETAAPPGPPSDRQAEPVKQHPEPAEPGQPSPSGSDDPTKIGPYTVVRRLGAGAMGEVWLGYDPSLERHVAIKMLRAENAQSTHHFDRFVREAKLAARLHHTNAVTVYQVGVEGQAAYIAMEYVEGQSLDTVAGPGRPMDWREATRSVRDAAAGLAAAHELGLIHRDIKPANLMRTTAGVTKVVDFGLARSQAGQTQLTTEGVLLGTPAYMAPEAWRRQQVDARSDLYALGCTYYYLLTGDVPFDGDNFMALGYQHTHEPLPDPREHAANLPDGVCRVLAKAAAKDPADRFQAAEELVAELDALLQSPAESLVFSSPWEAFSGAATSVGGVERIPQLQVGPAGVSVQHRLAARRRQPPTQVLIALAAGAALLLLGVIMYVVTDHGTVRIELSDPSADVEVKVDGDVIDVVGLKEPLRLIAGEHHLLVESGDYKSVSKSFTVRRGEQQVLHVTLEPEPPEPSVAEVRPPPEEPDEPDEPVETPKPSPAVYAVAVDPPDAEVTARGEGVAVEGTGAARTITVAEPDGRAKVMVVASLAGHETVERELQPQPGELGRLPLRLSAVPATAPGAPGDAPQVGE